MSSASIACPHCGTADSTRSVAAIVWEGQAGLSMRGMSAGLVGLTPAVGVGSHSGRMSSDLAVALAPPSQPPSRAPWFSWIAALILVGGSCAGLTALADHGDKDLQGEGTGWSTWEGFAYIISPLVAVIVLLIVLLIRLLRRDSRWRRAMPHMLRVWQSASYCTRCALVFFPRHEIPPQLPDRAGPGGFRDLVWLAGIIRCEAPSRPLP